ncbi:hypothetical protein C8R46DRAFT_289011 [Mycena filopes]|nr:hypothetical protein C8R46DRAFT_289011 [Mycena filopes]
MFVVSFLQTPMSAPNSSLSRNMILRPQCVVTWRRGCEGLPSTSRSRRVRGSKLKLRDSRTFQTSCCASVAGYIRVSDSGMPGHVEVVTLALCFRRRTQRCLLSGRSQIYPALPGGFLVEFGLRVRDNNIRQATPLQENLSQLISNTHLHNPACSAQYGRVGSDYCPNPFCGFGKVGLTAQHRREVTLASSFWANPAVLSTRVATNTTVGHCIPSVPGSACLARPCSA